MERGGTIGADVDADVDAEVEVGVDAEMSTVMVEEGSNEVDGTDEVAAVVDVDHAADVLFAGILGVCGVFGVFGSCG